MKTYVKGRLVRLAASLKDRLTPAHVVMQRLVNANASDRFAGALRQLGRLPTIPPWQAILKPRLRACQESTALSEGWFGLIV